MTLQQLEVLIGVAKMRSFTKAGQHLSLTQSAISHIISALELELGFALLYRNRAGIILTSEGERMLRFALDIVNKAKIMKQEAEAIAGVECGTLKVGCFPSITAEIMPDIMLKYQEQYPKIDFKLFEGSYNEIEEWVSNGIIDLGFTAEPAKGFDFIPLWKDELSVIASKSHPLSVNKSVSIEEIQGEPFIMHKSGCDCLIKDIFKENNVIPNVKFEIENNHAVLSMVSKGLGISIVPDMILNANPFEITTLNLKPSYFRTIGILIRSYKLASPAALSFINAIKNNK